MDEEDWSTSTTLRPGMDFHNGVTYFTVPLKRNMTKMPKGKDAEPIHFKELQTYVIPSKGKGFWYDEPSLELMGFVPSEQVFQERESNWSLASAKAYRDGEAPTIATTDLFTELRGIYTTYVEYADEAYYDIMALFLMYTYVYRLFESTGYIHFNGTMASGKSRNLSILNALAFNPVWAASMSAASLYRKLSGSPGTTLLDESEGFEGERGEDLRRILNAGYKLGSTAVRTEKGANDRFMPVEYDVFGPKAIAGIAPLEDVIASRCLVVAMRPAIREMPEFETEGDPWQAVRDRLYVWAMQNAAGVAATALEWRNDKHARLAPRLIGRQWEITSQFVILADYVGGEELASRIIEFLNGYFVKKQENLNATDRLRTTLRSLPRVLATKQPHPGHYYSATDIHEVVASFMEADEREKFFTRYVTKNLTVLGFNDKKRASGGVQVRLEEEAVRREFVQRRVEPFEEDTAWLAGEVNYQDQPKVVARPANDNIPEEGEPWWETTEDNEP
jgi:hypothetical protein